MTVTATAYQHAGGTYHPECLVEKLRGHPMPKNVPAKTVRQEVERLAYAGWVAVEPDWTTPPCALCERIFAVAYPVSGYTKDSESTWRCNVCPQRYIPDPYQHSRWHEGFNHYIAPQLR